MKKIGIGYENYKDFIEKNLYYVDKTLLVQEILDKGGAVTLLTRPRRFGKTLGLSMLRTYFELEYDFDGSIVDKRPYFEGKKIMSCRKDILSHMGRYPVIKLSLKGANQPDFYRAFLALRTEIISEFSRHAYLERSDQLTDKERMVFRDLLWGDLNWLEKEKLFKSQKDRESALLTEISRYSTALKILSEFLKKHHKKNVIVLLDEYDVPLENAWFSCFYKEMIGFIRSFFESTLKTNEALEFAVVTGCLRISKESIFTGLNNLNIISIRSGEFSEAFGFTETETMQMLADYHLDEKANEVREWYDGYLFGEEEIYNPWSVTNYVYAHLSLPNAFPEPYWSNTSSNSIIKDLIYHSDEKVKEELEILISGGTIEKQIHEDITYGDIYQSEDNIWNFLFFTGYMKKISERYDGDNIYLTMQIPNQEIANIYKNQVRSWFEKLVKDVTREEFYHAILAKDTVKMGRILTDLLRKSISTFDSAESFYHGYLLSMLIGMKDYSARSNREEGDGRPDITLYPENPPDPAYIFECKVCKKFNQMQASLAEAFDQIKNMHYEEGILDDGYAGVVSFGVCFCKKSCIVDLYT